jgi:hypothetical protein
MRHATFGALYRWAHQAALAWLAAQGDAIDRLCDRTGVPRGESLGQAVDPGRRPPLPLPSRVGSRGRGAPRGGAGCAT